MKFGLIRKEKEKNVLEFDFPYLIMEVKPTDPGKVHKFWLKALNIKEILKLNDKDNKLSWVFDENTEENLFYIVNINDVEESVDPTITLNLGLDFNNKKLHEKMTDLMGLNSSEVHKFQLEEAELYGLPAVKIVDYAIDASVLINEADDIEEALNTPLEVGTEEFNNL